MTDIKAFKFLDIDYEDSPGILITDDEYSNDLSSILSYTKLYYCKNNTCDETTGYIKLSNNEVYYCDSKYCSELQDVVECNDNHTNNIGKAFYDSSDDKFKICVNNGNSSSNNFRLRTISSSNKNYIFNLVNKNSLLYRLYISDKGGNIIGLSTTDGNYLVGIDVNNDTKTDMIKCTSSNGNASSCYRSTIYGYFLNTLDDGSFTNFIYCSKEEGCSLIQPKDGFFLNDDNEIFRCNSTKCELIIDFGSTCENNQYKFIKKNKKLMYCNRNAEVEISSTEKYYQLSEIDVVNSSFPENIISGNGYILLKVSQYSITQITTDSYGICVNKDNTRDNKCNTKNSYEYICLNINETCSKKLNICQPKINKGPCSGYYLVDINEDTNVGTLYHCTNTDEIYCNIPDKIERGYFKVTDNDFSKIVNYFKCDDEKCTKLDYRNGSGCNYPGDLHLQDEILWVCIDYITSVRFIDNFTQVIMKIDKDDEIFGTQANNGNYVMLNYGCFNK
eukprot:jgi/Orpsp1_1/1184415/evm.model.c7180000089433.1